MKTKNYFLTIYLLPIILIVLHCSLTIYFYTSKIIYLDFAFISCSTGIALGYLIHLYFKKEIENEASKLSLETTIFKNKSENEFLDYDQIFYLSKLGYLKYLFISIFLFWISYAIGFDDLQSKLISFGTIVAGLILFVMAGRKFLDNSPKLKLAKTGLWTQKLGFVDWKNIDKAEFYEQTYDHSTELYLLIFLKKKKISKNPDENLCLTNIDRKQFIETYVVNYIRNRSLEEK